MKMNIILWSMSFIVNLIAVLRSLMTGNTILVTINLLFAMLSVIFIMKNFKDATQ